MLNVVAIMGRLVADPELRTTTQGHSVCSFRIACDRSYVQQGQERQADFIDIVAWRQQADFVSKYFQKGSLIAVEGSLQTRNYQDKNGNKRTAVEVVANNISFAGAKRQDGQSAPSYEQQTTSHVQQAKAAQNAPQPAYTQGSMDDFAVINDNDDLPF
nr:MAG TPA: Single strand binding protein [Caudoviricetes sp.]